jgi:hypothetical protein
MTVVYRNTGPWGAGLGRVLTSMEGDTNFWTHDQAITALQALPLGVGISTITQTAPNQFTIALTDGRNYVMTIPELAFTWRGVWAPFTYYSPHDLFSVPTTNSIYQVLWGHSSAATFDPNANDGVGHSYYALWLQVPNPLPTGGATGNVLAKNSTTDYDTLWLPGLPVGGAVGSALFKNTLTNYDTLWRPVNFIDVAGTLTPTQQRAGINTIPTPTAGAVLLNPALGNVFSLTPASNVVINAAAAPVDARAVVIISTAASSYNISFATLFLSAGVLATGTVAGKRFAVSFVGDGNNFTELSRSGPM